MLYFFLYDLLLCPVRNKYGTHVDANNEEKKNYLFFVECELLYWTSFIAEKERKMEVIKYFEKRMPFLSWFSFSFHFFSFVSLKLKRFER